MSATRGRTEPRGRLQATRWRADFTNRMHAFARPLYTTDARYNFDAFYEALCVHSRVHSLAGMHGLSQE